MRLSWPFRSTVTAAVLRARLCVVVLYFAGMIALVMRSSREELEWIRTLTPFAIAIPAAWIAHSLQLATAFSRDRRDWRLRYVAFHENVRQFVGKRHPSSADKQRLEEARDASALLVVSGADLGLAPAFLAHVAEMRGRLSALAAMPAPDQSNNLAEQAALGVIAENEQAPLRDAYRAATGMIERGEEVP